MDDNRKMGIGFLIFFLLLIVGFITVGVGWEGDGAMYWIILVICAIFLIGVVTSKK